MEQLTENIIKDGIFDSTDEINLDDKNKTSAKQMFKTQIQFRRLLQTSPQKVLLSKGTIEDLKGILNDEINNEINEKYASVPIIIKNPASLVNKTLEQKWEDEDGFDIWWEGKVLEIKDNELCIKYKNSPDVCYLTVDEVITDVLLGDMYINWSVAIAVWWASKSQEMTSTCLKGILWKSNKVR